MFILKNNQRKLNQHYRNNQHKSAKISINQRLVLPLILCLLFISPVLVFAANINEKQIFFVDKNFDQLGREKIFADLKYISRYGYFYFDSDYLNSLQAEEKYNFSSTLSRLADDFDNKIYPVLTQKFGFQFSLLEINKDGKITILFHPLKKGNGGYFSTGNMYLKYQYPSSNEREMIYINTDYFFSPKVKDFLAHEFTHLIEFLQKSQFGQVEDTWLSESRAQYGSELINGDSKDSDFTEKIKIFLENYSDPLIDWQNKMTDYGVSILFFNYLVDHFGEKILTVPLHSSQIGIASLNEVLSSHNFDFSQSFVNWALANLVNDCNGNIQYCYINEKLKNLRIVPKLFYIAPSTQTIFSSFFETKNFALNYYKIFGGSDYLNFEINGPKNTKFVVPYMLEKKDGKYKIDFLKLDGQNYGELNIPDFYNYQSLVVMPLLVDEKNLSASFSWKTTSGKGPKIKENPPVNPPPAPKIKVSCPIYSNLFYGMQNNEEVKCLQEFLKSQGAEIYPEGMVTGNFYSLTLKAVNRFQEKYRAEILAPLGISQPTGFVGLMTRTKINSLR